MIISKRLVLLPIALLTIGLSACVSMKKFDEQKALADKYLSEKNDCNEKMGNLQNEFQDISSKYHDAAQAVELLSTDSIAKARLLRKAKDEYNDLNAEYEALLKQNSALLNASSKDKEALNMALLQKQGELSRRESEVNRLTADLEEREKRVKELESALNKQDSSTTFLKNKLMEALTGFSNNDLTVVQKDGKIYVSMSDKLLFKSGSFTLDDKGKAALGKVAEVLKKQTAFTIVVEGHTDGDKYKSPQGLIKDNWDLSVMRATTVVKVLTEDNKLDAKRVVASGHGEYNPVSGNDTDEGKSKNRRTEIILSPDLKGLYNLLKTK